MTKSEKIQAMKWKKYNEQDGKCAYCGKLLTVGDPLELAHILPQRKWIVAKYGPDIIHHHLNMKLTHPGICNSGVQISPNKDQVVKEHVDMIRKEIENEQR